MFDEGPCGLTSAGDCGDLCVQCGPCLSEYQGSPDKDEHDERQQLGPDDAG